MLDEVSDDLRMHCGNRREILHQCGSPQLVKDLTLTVVIPSFRNPD